MKIFSKSGIEKKEKNRMLNVKGKSGIGKEKEKKGKERKKGKKEKEKGKEGDGQSPPSQKIK